MELKNFCEIEAINEDKAIEIIKRNEKTDYRVAVTASSEGPGVNLDSISLVKLLAIFGNSKNLERDFGQLANELFKKEEKRKSVVKGRKAYRV
ncbi:hypothetical protein ES702_01379 [subsurface metagenome]